MLRDEPRNPVESHASRRWRSTPARAAAFVFALAAEIALPEGGRGQSGPADPAASASGLRLPVGPMPSPLFYAAASDSPTALASAAARRGDRPAFVSPQRLRRAQPWRTAAELGIPYALLAANYVTRPDTWQPEDRLERVSLKKILSPSRLRFDANHYYMNNVEHPIGGTVYYGIPRANGASAMQSLGVLTAADVIWEHVVELPEIASINDHMMTIVGGFANGEVLFQDRTFIRRGRRTPLNVVLDRVFGFPANLTEAVAARPGPAPAAALGRLGLPADVDSRIFLYTGTTTRQATRGLGSGTRWDLGLHTEIVNVPPAGSAGDGTGWLSDVAATEGDFGLAVQDGRLVEAHWFTQVVPFALVRQRYRSRDDATPRGHTLSIGPSAAWDVISRGRTGLFLQQRASVLAGLSGRAAFVGRGTGATLALDAWANFSSVVPYVTGRWEYPAERVAHESTVFRTAAYYYGAGPSARGRLTLRGGPFTLEASALQHRMYSFRYSDPAPEATEVARKWDRWTNADVRLGVRVRPGLEVSSGLERGWYRGAIGDNFGAASEHGWTLRISALP